ncbi:hypothetical protein DVA67_018125 [Solirubrobacter sp. CPCC 204708]|uniref:Uncharacterized protein n=1 Tax=Solirubrobacter deserti TaxID=2282478 RepID=A0ABT4RCS7_9ACTN|nr:hypothetical protein [Solirubrobacter deserti]MBE2317905.1 hypothetical protein [Solirubrobacter deserti]MDA0136318.1 hypothetical protein [Solirubrobacter deserti]
MGSHSTRARHVVLASTILVLGIAPLGVAATGGALREGVRNGTATKETEIVSNNGTGYTTRQSNKSTTGGGAIYGCRSTAGAGAKPCLRVNNLATGFAFEFNATGAASAGTITVGSGGDGKKPFTTNATGVATGLNADRVDGVEPAALRTRWLLINEAGQIEEQSGGFTVLDAYQTNQNVYIDPGASLNGKGLSATIAIQNKLNVDTTDPEADPVFGGEVSVARCQTVAVECAPANSKTPNALVVSPRNSDGTATAGTDANPRKRVYVTVTE